MDDVNFLKCHVLMKIVINTMAKMQLAVGWMVALFSARSKAQYQPRLFILNIFYFVTDNPGFLSTIHSFVNLTC